MCRIVRVCASVTRLGMPAKLNEQSQLIFGINELACGLVASASGAGTSWLSEARRRDCLRAFLAPAARSGFARARGKNIRMSKTVAEIWTFAGCLRADG